ncbi:unnamed protein product [Didymodactylos carnosus]|uniref:sulfite oxidase n=1 Tax=Didymodactylos carnosus TaxID=1234261 RepID=A0A814RB65_9BILA|nr:unnamed protein product [Didymodactylos carnosus]CAF3893826.1 unnamed protein product [Didymodactylos carnosus]
MKSRLFHFVTISNRLLKRRINLSTIKLSNIVPLTISVGLTGYAFSKYLFHNVVVHAETAFTISDVGERKPKLPVYSMEDVAKHTTKESGYWLAFKDGVYDVSSFVENHPGGKQILITAGKALESCWKIFTIHQIDHVYEILEEYRIGNLKEGEREKNEQQKMDTIDLFQYDPERVNEKINFIVRSQKPYNAETQPLMLIEHFITPTERFYVRNHMHVPFINIRDYALEVQTSEGKKYRLTYDELKNEEKYSQTTIVSALQCAGNRRAQMGELKPVQGAIGNATWTGVKLYDVLRSFGVLDDRSLENGKIKHVQFYGLDCDASQRCYGASVPIEKVLDQNSEILLVFKMNGETLTTDHGYPVRVLIPGTIGARSVKWLNKIILSDKEASSHWQQADYKVLPSTVLKPQQSDYDLQPSIQEGNVQSAICQPPPSSDSVKILSTKSDKTNGILTVKGYAIGGGGRAIQNVQISVDNGQNWFNVTNLEQQKQAYMQAWAWTLWSYDLNLKELELKNAPLEIVCRAMDIHTNTQPDTCKELFFWLNISRDDAVK